MSGPPPNRLGRKLRGALSYLAAGACLVWVFHDADIASLLQSLRALRWSWLALAIGVDVLGYAIQGLRWRLLLRPTGRLSWIAATQAIYAGLFTSEVLPMRPGEVLRAYVVSQWLRADLAAVLSSIMVERLFDGVWLALGMGVAAMLVPLPRDLLRAADALGLLILLATCLFLYVVLRTPADVAESADDAQGVHAGRAIVIWLKRLQRGAQDIGLRRETYIAFGLSLALLTAQIVAFWLVMVAYRLDVGVWAAAATLMIVHLGTAVPNAPANVGTFQFFCVVGLMLFGVDKNTASGFSVLVFVILTVPLWLLGSIALGRTGVSLATLRTLEHHDHE